MIFVIPLVLGAAILALRGAKRDARVAGAQGRWFLAWAAAGAALTFSFLTGLSIGLFVLPFAGLLLWWVARRTRHLLDATGFVAGIGVVLVLVAFLNRSGSGLDPMPWLVAGVCLAGSALLAYALLRRSRPV
jgi:hypothetical protein